MDNLPVNRSVLPGQRLCRLVEPYQCGVGVYEHQGFVHASLAGKLSVERLDSTTATSDTREGSRETPQRDASTPTRRNGSHVLKISVIRASRAIVPSVGSIVVARITCITSRFAKCGLVAVDGVTAQDAFRGLVRKEDVRATEKDKVEIHKSFQPGDLIVARVLSLGDAHSYLLSTAENELGVVVAYAKVNQDDDVNDDEKIVMVPFSWCEMRCPLTGRKELRKVAKPQPEYLDIREA